MINLITKNKNNMRLIIVLLFFTSCTAEKYLTNATFDGEILYPDLVHSDTLIVTDAYNINRLMDKVKTDAQIQELLDNCTLKVTSFSTIRDNDNSTSNPLKNKYKFK